MISIKFGEGIFAIKLSELEHEYGKLHNRLEICQHEEHGKILKEIERLRNECLESQALMEATVKNSHSEYAAGLAEAQLCYSQKADQYIKKIINGIDEIEEKAEAMTLYAEYAADFATQSMKQAVLAALTAMELQLSNAERKSTNE